MKSYLIENPENLRIRGILYLLIFLSGLLFGAIGFYTYDHWSSGWDFLILSTYFILMYRLIRGVLLRCLNMKKHIWKVKFYPHDKIAEIWSFERWFEIKKYSFTFEELTAVVHKTNISRLNFQFPIIRDHLRYRGVGYLIKRYILRRIWISLLAIVTIPLSMLVGREIVDYDRLVPKVADHGYDSRPTALSFVKGRNELSLMALSSYGWKPEDVGALFNKARQLGIKIFDKRPPIEIRDEVFL